MNKRTFFIILLLIWRICNAQTPNWEWAYCGGGNEHDMGRGITADAIGNIYTTGSFNSPTITFGSITLNNSGLSDAFVVKYDALGNVKWVKKFGGTDRDAGFAVTTDSSGNIYVTGTYSSPLIIFNNDTLINNGNIFIAKYDSSGNEIWATSTGGAGSGTPYSIAVDLFGNTCITGNYGGPTITFGNTILSNSGQSDVFIAKFSTNGAPWWAKKAGGSGSDEAYCIASDMLGNVYAAGNFWSSSISLDTATLVNGGQTNFYVVKFDPFGNMLWHKSATGFSLFGSTAALGMTIDIAANVYITGIIIGSASFGLYGVSSIGSMCDVLIVKYNSNGTVLFAKRAGGINNEYGEGISRDVDGNLYVIGRYEFGDAQLGTTTLPFVGHADCHVSMFDTSGNIVWAVGLGGPLWEHSTGITNDINGGIFITGQFRSTSLTLGGTTLTNSSIDTTAEYFIAKLSSTTTSIPEENYNDYPTVIFPNPFSDKLHITKKTNEISEILLYDTSGRILFHQYFTTSISLNTDQLEKGIYIYEVRRNNHKDKTGKVVKD